MKKAMLFVSFGTSYAETRAKTIDAIEAKVRDAYPACTPYSAWTSPRIIAKVRAERGEHHDTVEEALARMAADGVDDLIVSTTCLLDGREMAKITEAVEKWAGEQGCPTCIAKPLLASPWDCAAVARVVCDEFAFVPESDALLLMGHGSPKPGNLGQGAVDRSGVNEVYSQIQDELRKLGRDRFFVATVEGAPSFADVLPLVEASGAARVYLAPLMIVAGDHACNDLAGDGEDSWASMLRARGLQVEPVLKGLGEYPGIQQLVCDHVNDALTLREVELRG